MVQSDDNFNWGRSSLGFSGGSSSGYTGGDSDPSSDSDSSSDSSPQRHHQDHPMAVQAMVIVGQLRMQKQWSFSKWRIWSIGWIWTTILQLGKGGSVGWDRDYTLLPLVNQTIKLMIGEHNCSQLKLSLSLAVTFSRFFLREIIRKLPSN